MSNQQHELATWILKKEQQRQTTATTSSFCNQQFLTVWGKPSKTQNEGYLGFGQCPLSFFNYLQIAVRAGLKPQWVEGNNVVFKLNSFEDEEVLVFFDIDIKGVSNTKTPPQRHAEYVNFIVSKLKIYLGYLDLEFYMRNNGHEGGIHAYSTTWKIKWNSNSVQRIVDDLNKHVSKLLIDDLQDNGYLDRPEELKIIFDAPNVWGFPGFSKSNGSPEGCYRDNAGKFEPFIYPVGRLKLFDYSKEKWFVLQAACDEAALRVARDLDFKTISSAPHSVVLSILNDRIPEHRHPLPKYYCKEDEIDFVDRLQNVEFNDLCSRMENMSPTNVYHFVLLHTANIIVNVFNTDRSAHLRFFKDVADIMIVFCNNMEVLADIIFSFVAYGMFYICNYVFNMKIDKIRPHLKRAVRLVTEVFEWERTPTVKKYEKAVEAHFQPNALSKWYSQYHTVAALSICVLMQNSPKVCVTNTINIAGENASSMSRMMYDCMKFSIVKYLDAINYITSLSCGEDVVAPQAVPPDAAALMGNEDSGYTDNAVDAMAAQQTPGATAAKRNTSSVKATCTSIRRHVNNMLVQDMVTILDYYHLGFECLVDKLLYVWENGWRSYNTRHNISIRYEKFINMFFKILVSLNMDNSDILGCLETIKMNGLLQKPPVGINRVWSPVLENFLKWDYKRVVCFAGGESLNLKSSILALPHQRNPFCVLQCLKVNFEYKNYSYAVDNPNFVLDILKDTCCARPSNSVEAYQLQFDAIQFFTRQLMVWASTDAKKVRLMLDAIVDIFNRKPKTFLHFYGKRANNGKTSFLEAIISAIGECAVPVGCVTLSKDDDDKKPDLVDSSGAMVIFYDDIRNLNPSVVNKITGGAPGVARKLHQNMTKIVNDSVLMTTGNESFKTPTNGQHDFAFDSRLNEIEFKSIIVPYDDVKLLNSNKPHYDLTLEDQYLDALKHLRQELADESKLGCPEICLKDPRKDSLTHEEYLRSMSIAISMLVAVAISTPRAWNDAWNVILEDPFHGQQTGYDDMFADDPWDVILGQQTGYDNMFAEDVNNPSIENNMSSRKRSNLSDCNPPQSKKQHYM